MFDRDGTQTVTAQWRCDGVCRPGKTSVLRPLPITSITDILMVTTTALVWIVTNSTLSWGCNYVMQIPAESVLQCKREFARSGQILEFHIFAPPNAAPAQCRPGRMPPPTSHNLRSRLQTRQGKQSIVTTMYHVCLSDKTDTNGKKWISNCQVVACVAKILEIS